MGISDDNCIVCSPGLFKLGISTCLTVCPTYYYGDKLSSTCQNCDPVCLRCIGPLVSDCTSCNDGYYFDRTNKDKPC